MATALKQRSSLSAAIFPTKISTEQQSLLVVKRLLAIAVSCITYLRGIFPECAYATRYLDDLCVKILKEDKNCPSSSQLVKCKNQGTNSNITCAETKKASILLIRKIYILMQNLGPLPDDVYLTMKLFYYDEVTPSDYQPPGFKEGDCEGIAFEGEPIYLNVGEIPTPFHMLKVKVTTEKDRMERIDKTLIKEGNSLPSLKAEHFDEGLEQKNDVRIFRKFSFVFLFVSFKVEHLVNKTSELEVTVGKTRSGKKFQSNTVSLSFLFLF
uniref:HORMA domain-containing protein 1 n=1 Tax=Salvator merianae TaxID=96440 RepID=A0A8D0E858_SALMN